MKTPHQKTVNAKSIVNSSNLADDPCKLVTDDSDNDVEHKTTDKHDVPNDFVDEELLKDREVGLSESEKELLKEEAEKLKNKGNDFSKREIIWRRYLCIHKDCRLVP